MALDDFRSRVARAPDAIAVQDGELRLTYLELARHASGLAGRLTRRGIGQDDVVAVYAGRSAELVVAELAVLGRADDQVKIRVFRVEPGEVAAVLRSHPAVRDAVVIVTSDGAPRHLIGYVTPADGQDPSTLRLAQLRDFLAQRLPDYLIPTGFKAVDRPPLGASGKVDCTALPAPDHDTCGPVAPPRGATEERPSAAGPENVSHGRTASG